MYYRKRQRLRVRLRLRYRPGPPAQRRIQLGRVLGRARFTLRGFRRASVLSVALTGLLLLILAPQQAAAPETARDNGASSTAASSSANAPPTDHAKPDIKVLVPQSAGELQRSINNLVSGFLINLPKFVVAVLVLLLAWLLAHLLRRLVRGIVGRWEKADAITVLVMAGFWLIALGIAASILAGDLRALIGSLGLVGLALSWALQTPIESFTGWLLNSMKGYYRVGDRIAVGEIFGDVYQIDVLTTTLWEIGGTGRPGSQVHAEQPTGRLITFPNHEILTGTVVNLTKDFPYVWNELEVALASQSELDYALKVLQEIAESVLRENMQEPARRYAAILKSKGLETSVPDRPQLYVSMQESATVVTIRYLVNARERRPVQSRLTLQILSAMQKPEHAGRIVSFYPRRQVQMLDPQGLPERSGGAAEPGPPQ